MTEASVPDLLPDLLIVAASAASMAVLVSNLTAAGVAADLVHDLQGARQMYFQRGGHRVLVLAPDLPPAIACQVLDSLTSIDCDLTTVVFDDTVPRRRRVPRLRVAAGYHPSSRAAAGAVLKAVRSA